jgi:hypothetical protein
MTPRERRTRILAALVDLACMPFGLALEWAAALDRRYAGAINRAGDDGCDCAELCSMGPTCPGGMLAGLPGAGCRRTEGGEQ